MKKIDKVRRLLSALKYEHDSGNEYLKYVEVIIRLEKALKDE